MFNYLNTFLSMEFHDPYEKYVIGTIIAIYNTDLVKTLNSFIILKTIIVEQMDSFFVVGTDRSMKDLEDFIQNGKITKVDFEKILTQCIFNFEMYINILKEHLIFLK